MKLYTTEELKGILEKHLKLLRKEDGGEYANLSGADLRGANLERADLSGADLTGARNIQSIPDFCKWTFLIGKDNLEIGCEIKSWDEWNIFFSENQFIETDPREKELEYALIKAKFEYCKSLRPIYTKMFWEKEVEK
jgi:uncharacterized protein YjbI with pentapeptide repeats